MFMFSSQVLPRGYVMLQRSVNGRVANLNKGNAGDEVFLCVRPGMSLYIDAWSLCYASGRVIRSSVAM